MPCQCYTMLCWKWFPLKQSKSIRNLVHFFACLQMHIVKLTSSFQVYHCVVFLHKHRDKCFISDKYDLFSKRQTVLVERKKGWKCLPHTLTKWNSVVPDLSARSLAAVTFVLLQLKSINTRSKLIKIVYNDIMLLSRPWKCCYFRTATNNVS